MRALRADGSVLGEWSRPAEDGERIVCELCPRGCHLKDGDRGFCFVRENRGGQMVLSTYGRSTGFCIDPIEKKPLHHFLPGTSVLSFGTAGCNLGCKFCQNWAISKSREVEKLSQLATPHAIATAAAELGCRSVAFTYNDPVIWAEYAIDTAVACRDRGIKSVAVTAGYISPSARPAFFEFIDAANVDLKGFTEDFYSKVTNSHLAPVLDTLRYLKHETEVWFELTNLVIPNCNDDVESLKAMSDWIVENLGPDVPLHFSAFHPDFRMRDRPNTPHELLIQAYDIARAAGIRFVYVGNVHDPERQQTRCPKCRQSLIERDWYSILAYRIRGGLCYACRASVAGLFDDEAGTWGRKRQPVDISRWSQTSDRDAISSPSRTNMTTVTPFAQPARRLDFERLTETQKGTLLTVASTLIAEFASGRSPTKPTSEQLGELCDLQSFGVFTTLKRGKTLRGCCGSLGMLKPISEHLWEACHRTTLHDTRMPPISPYELPYLKLDISFLEQPEPIAGLGEERANTIEIGRHGLIVQKDGKSGLLLPMVSVEQGWNVRQFLAGVCRKAGLLEGSWLENDTKLSRFAGNCISGSLGDGTIRLTSNGRALPVDPQQLGFYLQWIVSNISALTRGATPAYYLANCPDATINGVVLSLVTEITKRPIMHLIQMSLRPGIPLQATLFELTKSAVQAMHHLRDQGEMRIELSLSLLSDPTMHGSLLLSREDSDPTTLMDKIRDDIGLEGLADGKRALLMTTGREGIVVSFDPENAPAFQIANAAKTLGFRNQLMHVYSAAIVSTRKPIFASNVAPAVTNDEERKPAVAGSFYPADDAERKKLVASLTEGLTRSQSVDSNSLKAIMVPHAGLRYSGRIAAHAWRHVAFDRPLLMFGPKHTPDGVPWAVSPSRRWRVSSSKAFETDQQLANELVAKIPEFEFDARAHFREHGVEVQLPLLEYFLPESKFVAVAMHGATWESLTRTAVKLAAIIRTASVRPVLVISSDMNHYQPEVENRRRDRLALDAMLKKDPKKLLEVCQQNEISMCGLIPAALVLQTLIEIGEPFDVEELSYGTSGDVQPSATVVGYAALAFR